VKSRGFDVEDDRIFVNSSVKDGRNAHIQFPVVVVATYFPRVIPSDNVNIRIANSIKGWVECPCHEAELK
jgi:hypothetical protein